MPENPMTDPQRRYSWYAKFLKQAGVAPRPFEDWLRLYKSDPSRMDVSPQSTTVDKAANAVPASGEIEKNATGEASYEIQRQASNPWNGFWESFFNASRGGQPETPPAQEPSPDRPIAAEVTAPPAEKPNRILVGLLGTMFEDYSKHQRSLSDLTRDFDRALRQQALVKGFDAALERHQLIEQMSDALDHEALKSSMAAMLEARMGTPEIDREVGAIKQVPGRFVSLEEVDSLSPSRNGNGNGKFHPKNRFEKQLYDILCRQFGAETYSSGEQVDLQAEPDKYPELAEYAIQAEQPDQYAGPFNPLAHPRGGIGNSGQFTKKVGPDPDMLGMSDEVGGPVGGGGEEPPMPVVPPLPPAKASVARVDLPDEINNRIQELAAHIPDYLLDGDGRTKDAHVTIKMLSDDDPSAIAQLLQDEPPFRAALGKLTITDANEERPFDIVKIAVHSPAIQRIHRKLSRALDKMQTTNGYQPYIRVADVQPGTADRLLGWDGLEGESVVVDSLTFVNREHQAHKIPLKGKEGEYVLEQPYTSDSQGIERPIAEQYAARRGYKPQHATPLFDQPPPQPQAVTTPPSATPTASRPPVEPSPASFGPLFAQKPTTTPKPPREARPMPSLEPSPPSSTDYTPDEFSQIQREASDIATEISEARRNWKPPEESLVQPEPETQNTEEPSNEPGPDDTGPVSGESEFGSHPNAGDESRGLDAGRTGSVGDRGTRGPRGLKTARTEFMPTNIDTSIVPQSVRGFLRPLQAEDTAMAIKAMTEHGGFLNASGTGSGKTYSTLATARYWADSNHKVLIITPNETINPDYEIGKYSGTFHKAGEAMNTLPILNNGTKTMSPGEVHITTYHRFHGLEDQVDDNTVVMWDESHLLKNQDSNRSQTGDRMNQKAKAVLYATATPADKVIHIAHLFRAKVFGNRAAEKTYRELGLTPYDEKNDDGTTRQSWRIDPDIGPIEVYRRLNGLFNQMTKEGLMVKRDLDMTGMSIYMKHIDFPQRANDILHNIEMEASGGLGIHGLPGIFKGQLLMDLRRQQEPFKVPYITELVKHELKDKGRQVIIYTSRVNPSDVRRGGETIFSSTGTPRLLKKQLETHFDARIGELHGGSDNPPEASMRNFQEGRTNVLIGTMDKAGIGIDLDDQFGDRPRTMIIMTAPFAGDRNAQTLGRIWRDSTRSEHGRTNAIYLFANTDIDHWNRDLIAGKMRVLGAVVQGAARDLEIPFDVGEEGLLDLARQNKTERERQRDMVARGQLKQHYQWRQLTGLPQEGPPPTQSQMNVEGLEQLQPGQIGYKQKSDVRKRGPSGPKRLRTAISLPGQTTMFTQDGDPERYTMTAAEIAEAVKSWKEPSKAQIEAENYTKPTIAWKGLTIKIETPKGKKRNPAWPEMPAHYGYFSRVRDQASKEARDGDKPDVFVSDNPESDLVVIIDQETPGGKFDEWKVIIGCNSEKEAIDLYQSAYTPGWRVGPATTMTSKQFKEWLGKMPDKGRIADQVSKYAAKYGFDDVHPRHGENKRFVEKHYSHTLAQTLDKPPTPGEQKAYDDYVEFLKIGGNKALPFKEWLQFHKTTKFYQAQKDREDSAKNSDEKLIGGKADGIPDSDFDQDALAQGTEVESEHTSDPDVAREIAKDHLEESKPDQDYYDKLQEIEDDDSGESEAEDGEDEDQDHDSKSEGSEDEAEPSSTRLPRHPGNPSKHSLAAVRDFAASFYTAYYQDKE